MRTGPHVARDATVVSADGTKLAVRCSGSGPALVLVHGAMGDLNAFGPVEERLAERHTVWVYSRRGRGGSGDGPDYRLEREVDDVLAVVDAAGGDAHLFGHSSGASYALLAAARAPALRSLALYEPPLHVDRIDAALVDRMKAALDAGDPDGALVTFFPAADIPDEEVSALRAQTPLWESLRRGVLRFPREHRALVDEGPRLLAASDPPDVPTLYLYGEHTRAPVYPPLDEIAQRLPNAFRRVLRGQRHLAPMFDPAAFVGALLEFTVANDG